MIKTLFALLIVITFSVAAFPQDKVNFSDFEFNPQFRSIQIDASTGFYVSKIGGAFDYDMYSNKNKKYSWASLGFRAGVDHIIFSEIRKNNYGPYTQINTYLRASIEGQIIRFDVFGGGLYQIASKSGTEKLNKFILKTGFDFKIKITQNYGIILNGGLSTGEYYLGIGLFLSFN